MNRRGFVGLFKLELPTRTVRLSDGAIFTWGAETYASKDDLFGTVESAEDLDEGVGAEVPAYQLTLLPAAAATPADLNQPGFQAARARVWLAEYDPDDGTITGTPDLQFDGLLDQTTLVVGRTSRKLEVTLVSTAERLFQRNLGNSLNPAFHKSVWPGETGEDQATGLNRPVAWGIEAPPGAAGVAGAGTAFSGGGTWWTGAVVRNV